MKITKFVHSCLLIEESGSPREATLASRSEPEAGETGKRILIDPGNYTFEEKALDLSSIPTLDYLLITHEHQDHMYLPFIKEIISKFPNVKLISNPSVAQILRKAGIPVQTKGDELIKMEIIPHEKSWMGNPVRNSVFKIAGKLTHPGDSHSFTETSEILALPITAPWGSTATAVELARKLKPKIIVPIHDWHWNEKARKNMYKRLEEYFASMRFKFLGLETGKEVKI